MKQIWYQSVSYDKSKNDIGFYLTSRHDITKETKNVIYATPTAYDVPSAKSNIKKHNIGVPFLKENSSHQLVISIWSNEVDILSISKLKDFFVCELEKISIPIPDSLQFILQ